MIIKNQQQQYNPNFQTHGRTLGDEPTCIKAHRGDNQQLTEAKGATLFVVVVIDSHLMVVATHKTC